MGIPKIQKSDLPKIPRFHANPTLFKKHRHLFKFVFDLIGLIQENTVFANFSHATPSTTFGEKHKMTVPEVMFW